MPEQNLNINKIKETELISDNVKLKPSDKTIANPDKFKQILKEVSKLDTELENHIKNIDKLDPFSPQTVEDALKSAEDAFKTAEEYKTKMQNLIQMNRLKLN